MFRTLLYFWKNFNRRPTKRNFQMLLKILKSEVKCLVITGFSINEIFNHNEIT
jgi:hypothetical protein